MPEVSRQCSGLLFRSLVKQEEIIIQPYLCKKPKNSKKRYAVDTF